MAFLLDGTSAVVPHPGWQFPGGTGSGAVHPFALCMRRCTFNCRGLFVHDSGRYIIKLNFVVELASQHDWVVLQETHGRIGSERYLEELLSNSHRCFWGYSPGRPGAGGTGILVKQAFLKALTEVQYSVVSPGRVDSISLRGSFGALAVFNLHLEPALNVEDRISLLNTVHQHTHNLHGAHIVVLGDFNSDTESCDRVDCRTGRFTGLPSRDALHFSDCFNDFTELHQDDFTHCTRMDGKDIVYARLSRIYANLPVTFLADLRLSCNMVGHKEYPKFTVSDHAPVSSAMLPRTNRRRGTIIPTWVSAHPLWQPTIEELSFGLASADDPWLSLQRLKGIFHEAAKLVKERASHHNAMLTSEKIWWCIKALRGLRGGNTHPALQAGRVYPRVLQILGEDLQDLNGLELHVQELCRTSAEDRAREWAEAKDTPEFVKGRKTSALTRWAMRWSPKRKKIALSGLRDSSGNKTSDPDACFAEVSQCWSAVFAEQGVDMAAAQQFLQQWARPLPPLDWVLSEENFNMMLDGLVDSCPGPDGVPYSCWCHLPAGLRPTLHTAYVAWMSGMQLPSEANIALLILIPKCDMNSVGGDSIHSAASQMRPLSLCNSDVKILEIALCRAMEGRVEQWAHASQRGFLRGRSMLQNILDVETRSLVYAHEQYGLLERPVAILFDFANAFPSLSQAFLWMVLYFIGVPPFVIGAIQQLYQNNVHLWEFRDRIRRVYVARSGVKQGGPLSALLFVIAIDCFLAALASRLDDGDVLTAFADDIAVVVRDLWRTGPRIADLFETFARISNLRLRPAKCVLIPLWKCQAASLNRLLIETLPVWRGFKVAFAGKYLGMWIGPDAGDKSWIHCAAKYESRCRYIKNLGLGMWMTIALYNSLAVSVLQFVAQMLAPPRWILQLETRMLNLLAHGPYRWLPTEANFILDAIGLPGHMRTIWCTSLAARGRVMVETLPAWRQRFDETRLAQRSDDLPLLPPWSARVSASIADHLDNAGVELLRLGVSNTNRLARGCESRTGKCLQAYLYDKVRTSFHFSSIERILDGRLARWRGHVGNEALSTKRLQTIAGSMRHSVPPCVVASLLHSWLNGWCTARRFQQTGVTCVFGCAECGDELEHYLVCAALWECASRTLHLDAAPRSISRALLFTPLHGDSLPKLALHNYAAMGAYNVWKHARPGSANLLDTYRERLRKAAALHKGAGLLVP